MKFKIDCDISHKILQAMFSEYGFNFVIHYCYEDELIFHIGSEINRQLSLILKRHGNNIEISILSITDVIKELGSYNIEKDIFIKSPHFFETMFLEHLKP